jgi:hypothetical protein
VLPHGPTSLTWEEGGLCYSLVRTDFVHTVRREEEAGKALDSTTLLVCSMGCMDELYYGVLNYTILPRSWDFFQRFYREL